MRPTLIALAAIAIAFPAAVNGLTHPGESTSEHSQSQEFGSESRALLSDRTTNTGTYIGVTASYIADETTRFFQIGETGGPQSRPITPDTVFEIGSLTKVFTAVLLADMVRTGELSYSDTIAYLAPEGTEFPSEIGAITLAQLSTHVSGLPRRPSNLPAEREFGPYARYSAADLFSFLRESELAAEPGTNYAYSNLGMGLLGELLATKAGMSYGQLLQSRIFGPLEMDTTVTHGLPEGQDFAQPHDMLSRPTARWDFDALAGAGAIRSTARDMAIFIEAALHGEQPIAQSIRETMRVTFPRPGRDRGDHPAWIWPYSDSGLRIFWHDGGTGGSRSVLAIDPDNGGRGIFIAANTVNSVIDAALHDFDPTYSVRTFEQIREISLPDDVQLDDYAGIYQIGEEQLTISAAQDGLTAQFTGDGSYPLLPYKRDGFFYTVADAQIVFTRENGSVIGATLIQGGVRTDGTRIAE